MKETLHVENFMIDPDAMEAAITPHAPRIIRDTPGGTTGCVYLQEILQNVLTVAQKHDLMILFDEIYEKLIYNGCAFRQRRPGDRRPSGTPRPVPTPSPNTQRW